MNIEYFQDKDVAVCNGMRFTRDGKTGYYLSTVKMKDGHRERLHRYVWESENGPIPEGYDIHHVDHDKGNNDISNLLLVSRSEHQRLHSSDVPIEERARILIMYAVPKSKAWHRSEEGREWHRRHGAEVAKNLEPIEYRCSYCGRPFLSKNRYSKDGNRFCSNRCRAAFRRRSGVDDVERRCEGCGEVFIANRYSKARFCQDCSSWRYRKGRG